MFRQQTEWLSGGEQQIVNSDIDFIGRFENLREDILRLSETVERPIEGEIQHMKPSDRRSDFRSYYNDQIAEIIAKAFAVDIDNFGYAFE